MICFAGVGLIGYGCYDVLSRDKESEKRWPIFKGEFLIGCGASLILKTTFINDSLLELNENSKYQDILKAYQAIADGIATSLALHTAFNVIGASPASYYIEEKVKHNFSVPLMLNGFCTTHIVNTFIRMTDMVVFFENIGKKIDQDVTLTIAAEVRKALNNATTKLSIDVNTGKVVIASPSDKKMVRWAFCIGVLAGCGILRVISWLIRNYRQKQQQSQIQKKRIRILH